MIDMDHILALAKNQFALGRFRFFIERRQGFRGDLFNRVSPKFNSNNAFTVYGRDADSVAELTEFAGRNYALGFLIAELPQLA